MSEDSEKLPVAARIEEPLIADALNGLERAMDFTGYDRNVTVNRALQLYATVVDLAMTSPAHVVVGDMFKSREGVQYVVQVIPMPEPRRRPWWRRLLRRTT